MNIVEKIYSRLLETVLTLSKLSVDTRVKHKNSGIEYTVVQINEENIVLKTPEGKLFTLDLEDFTTNYCL